MRCITPYHGFLLNSHNLYYVKFGIWISATNVPPRPEDPDHPMYRILIAPIQPGRYPVPDGTPLPSQAAAFTAAGVPVMRATAVSVVHSAFASQRKLISAAR